MIRGKGEASKGKIVSRGRRKRRENSTTKGKRKKPIRAKSEARSFYSPRERGFLEIHAATRAKGERVEPKEGGEKGEKKR